MYMLDAKLLKKDTEPNYDFLEVGRTYKITCDSPYPYNDSVFNHGDIGFPHGTVHATLVERTIDSLTFIYVYREIITRVKLSIRSWINYRDYITISKLVEE